VPRFGSVHSSLRVAGGIGRHQGSMSCRFDEEDGLISSRFPPLRTTWDTGFGAAPTMRTRFSMPV
jgi:hypothetical protein